jgi:cytochrome c peroxidase
VKGRAALAFVLACASLIVCLHSAPLPTTVSAAAFFASRLPRGLPVPEVPADNPISEAKVQLGRFLFYDARLSGNGTYSCSSCHQQARAFTDGRAQAIGSTGAQHARSALSLTNVAYNVSFGWADPARRTLEAQMEVPMFNEHPIELGLKDHESAVLSRFRGDDLERFRAAFPEEQPPVTLPHVVKAIASFERVLLSGRSRLDRYLYEDDRSAMPAESLRGMTLFFSDRLRCSECHNSFNLSGPVKFEGARASETLFHNTGLYNVDGRGSYPASDRGLFDRTHKKADMGRFRAPTLRNVAVTAPYMHDGSVATLQDAIEHYATGGRASPFKSDRIRGFTISKSEIDDLVAFLQSLTDEEFLTNPAFADPHIK